MIEYSAPATLVTPAGTTTFNPASGDGLYLTPDTTGLGQAPVRATVEDAPQTDGGLVHDAFKGARHLLIVAQYLIVTGTIGDRNSALNDLEAHLDSILRADGTWTMTETGDTAKVLTVRCDVGMTPTGGTQLKQISFGLVAADPAWT